MRHAGQGAAVPLSLLGTGKHYYSVPVDPYLAAVVLAHPTNGYRSAC